MAYRPSLILWHVYAQLSPQSFIFNFQLIDYLSLKYLSRFEILQTSTKFTEMRNICYLMLVFTNLVLEILYFLDVVIESSYFCIEALGKFLKLFDPAIFIFAFILKFDVFVVDVKNLIFLCSS